MGMTIAEKILVEHADLKRVEPGEIVNARIDVAMVHEVLGIRVATMLREAGVNKVWDPEKIVALLDHWVPAPNVEAAEIHKICRSFVKEHKIKYWYDMRAGICHLVLPEKGHVRPGELIVGSDSHTTTHGAFGAFATGVGATDMAIVFTTGKLWFKVPSTIKIVIDGKLPEMVTAKDVILHVIGTLGVEGANYKAVEFHGDTIQALSVDGRMTLCNMSVEMGAKAAIIEPDQKTIEYVKNRANKPFKVVKADKDAEYEEIINFDASKLEPQVAKPHSLENVVPVSEVEKTPIDQVFIGSCTNGKLEDLEIAAKILKNRKVHPDIRLIVIPASYEIYLKALKKGIIETIIKAGGVVGNPTCGPCIGGHLGVLGNEEVCVSTGSRNFIGRMGSKTSLIYLASPATAAASALEGEIADPRKYAG